MGFRDDREALRERAHALQQEVELLREELEEAERREGEHEHRANAEAKELHRLRVRVRELDAGVHDEESAAAPTPVASGKLFAVVLTFAAIAIAFAVGGLAPGTFVGVILCGLLLLIVTL